MAEGDSPNSSQILPLFVGAINDDEQHSTIRVNCNATAVEGAESLQEGLESLTGTVLFPKIEGVDGVFTTAETKVPIIGGSIVKIELKLEKVIDTGSSKKKKNKLGKYKTWRLEDYAYTVPAVDTTKEFPEISKIISTRTQINKALYDMPSISDQWHLTGVPSLVLSVMQSKDVTTRAALEAKIKPLAKSNIRTSGLNVVGSFKFIPIQILNNMLKALVLKDSDSFGLKNYVGISGKTFEDLLGFFPDDADGEDPIVAADEDEAMVQLLLDLFPIYNIDEDFIVGESMAPNLGYYTAYDKALYVKMPDLSGRDSSGYSSNIYSLGESSDEAITFCFELLIREGYNAIPFDYQPPPVVDVNDGDPSFPESSEQIEITISKEGLSVDKDELGKYKFYLSPIITPKTSVKAKGFSTTKNAVEMFTAPVITKPYYKPSDTTLSPMFNTLGPGVAALKSAYEDLVEYLQKDVKAFHSNVKVPTKTGAHATSLSICGNTYAYKNLGLPLSVPLTKLGVSRLSDIIGELNRPEILIGYRDGNPSDEKNDEKFFTFKTAGAREIVASNRPNILVDFSTPTPTGHSQIPETWIELTKGDATGEGQDLNSEWLLTAKYADVDGLYSSAVTNEFALYVVDHLGQFVRAPGRNIELYPNKVTLIQIEPNGTQEHGVVLSAEESFFGKTTLAFKGTGLEEVVSICFYEDEEGQTLLKCLKDGDEVGGLSVRFANQSGTHLKLFMLAQISEIVGGNVGTFYVRLVLENGDASGPYPLHIAAPGTLVQELPEAPIIPASFEEGPYSIYVPKFEVGSVDSVPILMDGQSAKIQIKNKKGVFGENTELYAYIAIANDSGGKNKKILEQDIGWYQEDIVDVSFPIESGGSAENFLVPTGLVYELGGTDFERNSDTKATLSFPGTEHSTVNLSRFSDLVGDTGSYAACILLTAEKLSSNTNANQTFKEFNKSWAMLSMGEKGSTPTGEKRRPFVSAPHVLGFAVILPSPVGRPRIESNIKQEVWADASLAKLRKKVEDNHINLGAIDGNNQNYQLVSSDGLDRLSIVFKGPNEPRVSKMYSATIGSEKLKAHRTGGVTYVQGGYCVANFKNITGIKEEGWTDIVISKKDKRFNVTYDSTYYNRTTVTFSGEEDLNAAGDSIVNTSGDVDVLASGKDRLIPLVSVAESAYEKGKFIDSKKNDVNYSVIFGSGGDVLLNPLPLLPGKTYPNRSPSGASAEQSYYQFANPIKIYPSVDLVFGILHADSEIHGMALGDAAVDDKGEPVDEVIGINTSGQSDVKIDILEVLAKQKEQLEKLAALKEQYEKDIKALQDAADAVPPTATQAQVDEYKDDVGGAIITAETEADAATTATQTAEEAHEAALASARSGEVADSGSSIGEDAAETVGAVADAAQETAQNIMEGVDALLSAIQAITDALSRVGQLANALLEGLEAAGNLMGDRPNDFVKVSSRYVYIDKGASIPTPLVYSNTGEDQFRLVLSFRFEQTAAIRFNVPEIVSAYVDKATVFTAYGDNPFSKMIVKVNDEVHLKTIGTTKDSKFEINGKREKYKKGSKFYEGIFMNFILTIPDMSSFSVFGTNECLSISVTNSQENRMRLGDQMGNDIALNLDGKWNDNIFGGKRGKTGPTKKLMDEIEMFFLKFTSVTLDKSQGAKEMMQSFCDFSFHLTAELSLQLRNFKVLLIPIKIIFCIIDVICALLHPIRLAFAIIRLFLCLYDLILLIPQLSVPAMNLALLLHLLELLLCVILKILSIINAINEIITALSDAIEYKNYPAMVALEEALNEHLFSLEADLSVLEPIITILALFLELLQLVFAFPCQIGAEEDDEACIDPSQLAGIILSKVAPFGRIEPDALLPLAQAYTTLPLAHVASKGNTPPKNKDPSGIMDDDGFVQGDFRGDISPANIYRTPEEAVKNGFDVVVEEPSEGGTTLPGLMDSSTGENKEVQEGGYFSNIAEYEPGDQIVNVDYRHLRFNGPDRDTWEGDAHTLEDGTTLDIDALANFQATFGLSFTKTKKDFAIFTGPDPRIVNFEFKGRGETNQLAFAWWFIAIFFRKKNIDILQTCDSPPSFLTVNDSSSLVVADSSVEKDVLDFISPIDGFGSSGESFIEATGVDEDGNTTFSPKPLTVTIDLQEPGIDPDTLNPIFTPVEVTKTFGSIPMIALVDHDFNVYFVQDDGIKAYKENGVWKIESIVAKMINKPSAVKHKFSREDQEVFTWDLNDSPGTAYGVTVSAAEEVDPEASTRDDGYGTMVSFVGDTYFPAKTPGYLFDIDAEDVDDPDHADHASNHEADGSIMVKEQANANAIGGIAGDNTVDYESKLTSGFSACDGGADTGEKAVSSGYSPNDREQGLWGEDGRTIPWSVIHAFLGADIAFTINWINELEACNTIFDGVANPTSVTDPPANLVPALEFMKKEELELDYEFSAGDFTIDDYPFPGYAAKDWAYGEKDDQKALQDSLDSVKFFEFPRFYIVDVRQCADDIAAACGASGPMELLMDLPGVSSTGEDGEDDIGVQAIQPVDDCLKAFLNHFNSTEEDDDGKPIGIIPKMRYELAQGMAENKTTGKMELAVQKVDQPLILTKYETLKECVEDAIGKTCRFVLNPLNTTFKLLGDDDETPLTDFVNPEQEGLADLIRHDIVDENELSEEMEGFPKITGAMEYASGIGDLLIVEETSKAIIEIIPRDCYDEPIPATLDLSDEIKIDFLTDETGTAKLVEVVDGSEELVDKDGATYTLAVSAEATGKVVIKATICSVIIQAVTEAGIIDTRESASAAATGSVDCVDDLENFEDEDDAALFAPGELMKVDRTLTILFVPKGSLSGTGGAGGRYGDDDRDESARSAKPGPQTFGTKLEN